MTELRNKAELYPDIAMLIEPTNELVTFQDSSIDLCIRYGEGKYRNLESHWLMDEVIYPVCHPLYQEKHAIHDIADLTWADLIEDTWPDMDWQVWLKNAGYESNNPILRYNGSHFVLEGALAVQGVALIKHALASRYIQEGKLVRIGNIALKARYQYYLCAPASYFKRSKVQIFSQWLSREIQQFHQNDTQQFDIREADFSL